MKTMLKCLLAGAALAGLAGCASYDYGYAYGQPYYGYSGYDQPYYGYNGPYYGYDNGPYYYDYPGYYSGAPAVGFSLGFSGHDGHDYDRHDGRYYGGHGRYDRNYDGGARPSGRSGPPSTLDSRTGNPNSLIEAHPAPLGTNQQ